jgi:protoporphyrinogen/coproporphyrinogen III oxidase
VIRVAVVGGGIAGLAAARALAGRDGVDVVLVEATDVVGGKLRTSAFAGADVDEGAEQVLVRVPEAVALMTSLGLGDDITHPRTSDASIWSRGRLRPLPGATVLGVPASPVAVARSGVVGPAGLLRAAGDYLLPRRHAIDDESVGSVVGRRLGRAIVDRLVDPLLGGVYAGRADDLSLAATVPQLAAAMGAHRTLTGAARAVRGGGLDGPVFASLVGGLGRLPDALGTELGARVRTGTVVRRITAADRGFTLELGDRRDPERLMTDHVLLATPAAPTARLLETVAADAARRIATIDYASVAIVTLAYPRASFPSVTGSGFLVPAVEGRLVKAVTFASNKWRHLDAGDLVIVRASIGRYGEKRDLQRDDVDLVAGAADDLAHLAGAQGRPVEARVTRWGGGLPQYTVGHLDRVAAIRAALPSGIEVCGAAYDGVGVPACIRSGQDAALRLVESLRQ